MTASSTPWAPLLMHIEGSVVTFQNAKAAADARIETLLVDLGRGECRVSRQSKIQAGGKLVAGVVGVLRLGTGLALAVVADVAQVGVLRGAALYKIKLTEIYTHAGVELAPSDHRLVLMLRRALDVKGQGSNMYMSYSVDLTSSCQRQGGRGAHLQASGKAAWAAVDEAYTWNAHIAKPLLEAGGGSFVLPITCGYVAQVGFALQLAAEAAGGGEDDAAQQSSAAVTDERGEEQEQEQQQHQEQGEAGVCIISRISCRRASAGIWRRGLSEQGDAAACVETEVIVTHGRRGTPVASHVQLSGTPPLRWGQVPYLWLYAQPLFLGSDSKAFAAHMATLHMNYGAVAAVDMLRQQGPEAALHQAFVQAAEEHIGFDASAHGAFAHLSFDYAQLCGRRRVAGLSDLEAQLAPLVEQHGCFVQPPLPASAASKAAPARQQQQQQQPAPAPEQQRGVLRLHSLQAVDRVAVVRHLVGRAGLELALRRLGWLAPGARLADERPELSSTLRTMWYWQTEALALQLAGSEARLADIVRHGFATPLGAFDDLAMTLTRWYSDAYAQARRQDVLDVLHGAYSVSKGSDLPEVIQPAKTLLLIVAVVQLLFVVGQLIYMALGRLAPNSVEAACMVLIPLAVGVATLLGVVRDSDSYIYWPELCPQLLPRPPPWLAAGETAQAASPAQQAAGSKPGGRQAEGKKKR